MKTIALVLVALTVVAVVPARAQVQTAPATAAKPVEKPKPTCICDSVTFKALTEKAKAVEEYWDARRTVKTASVIGGLGTIFGLIARDPNIIGQSAQGYEQARSKMWTAKAKAESMGALKVTGDDIDGTIEIKLVKGVDYTVDR